MEKKKKWHLALIFTVIALTLYNILPTLFYYARPLKAPIGQVQGMKTAANIAERLNSTEKEALDWLGSYCDLLHIKPVTIAPDRKNPQLVHIQFNKASDAARLRSYLPRAGSMISSVPAQLTPLADDKTSKSVTVLRRISTHIDPSALDRFFTFTPKFQEDGTLAPLYADLILDRAAKVAAAAAGDSEGATLLQAILSQKEDSVPDSWLLTLASQINDSSRLFKTKSESQSRLFSSLTQGTFADRPAALTHAIASMDALRDRIKQEKISPALKDDPQAIKLLEKKETSLSQAEIVLKKHRTLFQSGQEPLSFEQAFAALGQSLPSQFDGAPQILPLSNPYFSQLEIDWQQSKLSLVLHSDLSDLRANLTGREKDQLEQLLINEVARIARLSDEELLPSQETFTVSLHQLPDAQSFLLFKLDALAKEQASNLAQLIRANWHPKHPDLLPEQFPIVDAEAYAALSDLEKKLCLCVIAPAADREQSPKEFKNSSLYVLAKGLDLILSQSQRSLNAETNAILQEDFKALVDILRRSGFVGYPASALSLSEELASDYIFERSETFANTLAATREEFHAKGTKRFAALEFTDLEQRILTQNRIESSIHEDLLKWRDEYATSQVSLESRNKYDVPKPTKSVFWSNIALSMKKMFRGDDRKIIRWGLDLSGGKTVQIELRDQNNRIVTGESDLKQGINELFNRVNKMGVSEVAIRQLGNDIVLDFPGSQALTAAELVKASSMYFHVVNEKFSSFNPQFGEAANRFLQEVWNEAVVMNRKDPQSINAIAWKHLHGDSFDANDAQPRSDAARILYENGLRLQSPKDPSCSSAINDSVSKIALLRGKDFSDWGNQTHPLLFVFNNYALEGSNLANIRSSYDPSKGNFLSFEVAGSAMSRDGQKISPQSELQAWTGQFSKERITGTPNESHSRGQGWRMAVVLNDTVISSPTLNSVLRDSASISGNFSQREVNQLASDLKAGSLTFTPHILSEKNVSPELGQSDRAKGILATVAALVLVIAAMVGYYRFAGLVASIAVLFNLLIMWATLQNLQATLTLAGIAGIILTVGMAVDANVLVFERIKEEFALTKKIGYAIHTGYKKAFSAILDSNVTTIIAALILLNFDSGPIKGLAITLTIGIASSMFTALFMTRTYFAHWLQNPAHTTLTMANWIRATSYDFLKKAKWSFGIALAIIAIGCALLFTNRATIFGMDFTGGFAVNVEVQSEQSTHNYAAAVEHAFQSEGASSRDFQIRELNPSNNLRILFSTAMEQSGKPFYGLAPTANAGEHNPRVEWVLNALSQHGLTLTPSSLEQVDLNWTAMSGQMSDSMRNNALIGLLIAFACIFVYLAIRFESTYAASAIVCLLHDVFITLGLMGILHAFGVPIQIDLNTVAALMTIVGYSLNDTIIIFDRIREEMRQMRGEPLSVIVNHALNGTLSRTSITSGTTLLVLLALVILGGSSIFSFALVMTIGVFFGTLSSWFIAAPLMIYFHQKAAKKERLPVVNG